jgi:hypothetical protein
MSRNSATLRTASSLGTAVFVAQLLAGCGAGSQFAPPAGSAELEAPAIRQAPKGDRNGNVSPDWVMWTGVINGHYYFINRYGDWIWLQTLHVKGGGSGSTVGGSLASATEVDVAMTTGDIEVLSNNKLVTSLEGLPGVASAVETLCAGQHLCEGAASSTRIRAVGSRCRARLTVTPKGA